MKKFNGIKLVSSLITVLVMCLINVSVVFGLGVSAPESVSPNQSFTVSVTGLGNIRGRFFVKVTNGSTSVSNFYARGVSSEPIPIKAGASGTVTITVSPDTSSDTATIDGELITSVLTKHVEIKQPSSGGGSSGGSTNTPTDSKPDTRSKNNDLSSLTISVGDLSPKFSSSKTTYDVSLPGTAKNVTVDAKSSDSKATVSGTGKKTLSVGENIVKVFCKAENGSTKTYIITFHVDETPLVYSKLGDVNLGVVRNLSGVKIPDGFEKTTTKLENQDIEVFQNNKNNLVIGYFVDESGKKSFYTVEDGKIARKYEEISILGKSYILINTPGDVKKLLDLKESTIKIGDAEISGWVFEDEDHANYSIVYLMNDKGEKGLYIYETTEGTLQKYVPSTEKKSDDTFTYVFIGTTVLFAAGCGVISYMYITFKKKSISAIKDYYDKKNQGE